MKQPTAVVTSETFYTSKSACYWFQHFTVNHDRSPRSLAVRLSLLPVQVIQLCSLPNWSAKLLVEARLLLFPVKCLWLFLPVMSPSYRLLMVPVICQIFNPPDWLGRTSPIRLLPVRRSCQCLNWLVLFSHWAHTDLKHHSYPSSPVLPMEEERSLIRTLLCQSRNWTSS